MNRKIISGITTLGIIGYLPGPGTMATIASLPLVYMLKLYTNITLYTLSIVFLFCISMYAIRLTYYPFLRRDPQEVVIDECIGTLITFFAIPFQHTYIVLGFILFRLFDIYKWGFIKRTEQLPGAWGIILDDVVAGVSANIILHGILYVTTRL